ncbi:MAG: ferritin-like domain-containing protein [Fibrella sp.]|nr:ferritin-like domain-containing protein [Armatimonadota bacterium]
MKNWRTYYERNRTERSLLPWHGEAVWERVDLPEPIRTALLASLARFEVGESGEGKRLKAGALTTNDPEYCRAIEMFLNEEHDHAAWLGKLIDALGGEHLHGHWSDGAFVFLRHMGGLQTELLLLLAVEMIAQAYYPALRDGVPNDFCRKVFARICDDEDAHVAFHVEFLRKRFARQWWIESVTTRVLWYGLFRAACIVVMLDHAPILRAVGVSSGAFWQRTGAIFRHTSAEIWNVAPAPRVVTQSRL